MYVYVGVLFFVTVEYCAEQCGGLSLHFFSWLRRIKEDKWEKGKSVQIVSIMEFEEEKESESERFYSPLLLQLLFEATGDYYIGITQTTCTLPTKDFPLSLVVSFSYYFPHVLPSLLPCVLSLWKNPCAILIMMMLVEIILGYLPASAEVSRKRQRKKNQLKLSFF